MIPASCGVALGRNRNEGWRPEAPNHVVRGAAIGPALLFPAITCQTSLASLLTSPSCLACYYTLTMCYSELTIQPDERLGDVDSSYGDDSDSESQTTSLKSSVTNYVYENGRRYHAFRQGSYWYVPL